MDDNFILLDSDVLLKKDCSELFDVNNLYIGTIHIQPNKLKRVAPYMCYINVHMCKEYNVSFFDERYMHGLAGGKTDMYDTGGGFYINAN